MPRALFEKKGRAVWISHLDLMRVFQRAFKRASLSLTHSQGFNQRPSVSLALPLSVGVESDCELIDFQLEGEPVSNKEICDRLNLALVEGVRVKEVYDNGRKLRDLSLLKCAVEFCYDASLPEGALNEISGLFKRDCVLVPKKTKSGIQDQDIVSMIRSLTVTQENDRLIRLEGIICCQNPTLNPAQLSLAVEMYLPHLKPAHCTYRRLEIFDPQESIFR